MHRLSKADWSTILYSLAVSANEMDHRADLDKDDQEQAQAHIRQAEKFRTLRTRLKCERRDQ